MFSSQYLKGEDSALTKIMMVWDCIKSLKVM